MQIKQFIDNNILSPVTYFICAFCWASTAEIYNKIFSLTNGNFLYAASIGAVLIGTLYFFIGVGSLYVEKDALIGERRFNISINIISIIVIVFVEVQIFFR